MWHIMFYSKSANKYLFNMDVLFSAEIIVLYDLIAYQIPSFS